MNRLQGGTGRLPPVNSIVADSLDQHCRNISKDLDYFPPPYKLTVIYTTKPTFEEDTIFWVLDTIGHIVGPDGVVSWF